jgi:pimeloyl-ACP methyl ester carboxylesterase
MQWRHRTAVVNGIHIHYVTHGQGAPVLLLHGWPEFWYSWRKQMPVLGERFAVIAPDMRGFGYSDKPHTGYDTRTAASDMYALARVLGHQRVSIVAHDIGARVAYRLTLDHEETVARLAVLDATPPHERYGPQRPQVVRERWHSYFHQQGDLPEKLIEGREEIYLRHIFRDWSVNKYPISDAEVAQYVKAYSQPGALRGGFNY